MPTPSPLPRQASFGLQHSAAGSRHQGCTSDCASIPPCRVQAPARPSGALPQRPEGAGPAAGAAPPSEAGSISPGADLLLDMLPVEGQEQVGASRRTQLPSLPLLQMCPAATAVPAACPDCGAAAMPCWLCLPCRLRPSQTLRQRRRPAPTRMPRLTPGSRCLHPRVLPRSLHLLARRLACLPCTLSLAHVPLALNPGANRGQGMGRPVSPRCAVPVAAGCVDWWSPPWVSASAFLLT